MSTPRDLILAWHVRQRYATYAGAKEYHERYNALATQARRPQLTSWSNA